jgi:hypothetical protein
LKGQRLTNFKALRKYRPYWQVGPKMGVPGAIIFSSLARS